MATYPSRRHRLSLASEAPRFTVLGRDQPRLESVPDDESAHSELFQRARSSGRDHQPSEFKAFGWASCSRYSREMDAIDHFKHLRHPDQSSRSELRNPPQSPRSVARVVVPRLASSFGLQPSVLQSPCSPRKFESFSVAPTKLTADSVATDFGAAPPILLFPDLAPSTIVSIY